MIKSLRGRLLVVGALLACAMVGSALWSSTYFALLATEINDTLRASEKLLERAATLGTNLEREDDALLLALAGEVDALPRLARERERVADALARIHKVTRTDTERGTADRLTQAVTAYHGLGDELRGLVGGPNAFAFYHQSVNPALRRAVTETATLRESASLAMQATGIAARDGAYRATGIVAAIAAGSLLLAIFAALYLTRTVLKPIRALTDSAIALREGEFEHQVPVSTEDELGQLAREFNQMADSIAAFQRANLGEIMRVKELLETTLLALPDGVVVLSADLQIESMNPMAGTLLGLPASARPESAAALPLPDDVAAALADATGEETTVTRIGAAFAVETTQGERMIQAFRAPVPEHRITVVGCLLVLHDVTDFHRLDALRVDHIGITSHELKTPLTSLRCNLLLLIEEADNLTPRQREILGTAAQGCERLAAKVDRLLDLTRIESGELQLALERTDLEVVIEQAIRSLQGRAELENTRIVVDPLPEPLTVRGDAVRLTIVVANLLSNALKYSGDGTEIRISATTTEGEDGSQVQLFVDDQGIGVPQDLRERVFEKFFRVDARRQGFDRQIPGVGIGLYLCRQIVNAHGGTIRCETGLDERGSRFVLTLPTTS